jgi:hypothetical protein
MIRQQAGHFNQKISEHEKDYKHKPQRQGNTD